MAGPTVYEDVAEDLDFGSGPKLFTGKKFFVAQRVPIRKHLLDDIKSNGGEVVLLEKQADYLIADHFQNHCPPGSISYQFIEESIKQGELANPDDHPAGPPIGQAREAGATHQPPKIGRSAYTAEEDRILYKWVRDAEAAGGLASGNELYKQLEQKYPRHTWQSWRDRYLKKLKQYPPKGLSVADNAPPSPASDRSNERAPPVAPREAPKKKQPASKPVPATNVSEKPKKHEYKVNELTDMFTTEDWLDLYAYVDLIDATKEDGRYDAKWVLWAEHRGEQTSEQWRQYYEKVVRPQWLRDPQSKRDRIREEMDQKHAEEKLSQSQSVREQLSEHEESDEEPVAPTPAIKESKAADQPSESEDEGFENFLNEEGASNPPAAYKLYAREMRQAASTAQPSLDYAALHNFLLTQWHSLSEDERAPYLAMDQALTEITIVTPKAKTRIATDNKLPSSSTARPESPEAYRKLHETFVKRLRDNSEDEEDVQVPRPIKRRKSRSATPTNDDVIGTVDQPLEISSAESFQSLSESELAGQETGPDMPVTLEVEEDEDEEATMVEHGGENEGNEVESIESDDFLRFQKLPPPPDIYDTASEDELPSNTPTPRAVRQTKSIFDTQAILSSPTEDPRDKFIRSFGKDATPKQKALSPSPFDYPESVASTTQSLEEFRSSLREKAAAEASPKPLRISASPSPAPSSVSSTGSGDPDPPLTADEINEFFDEQNARGISNAFVSAALTRTRLRPDLAIEVLDAWTAGKPLPNKRGIWSKADDEVVEGCDGPALKRLEKKHTTDGWGGITERLIFLEGARNRRSGKFE
ncbi:Myb-DNA-bind-2 multi-domain protein [Pyrenophora tritici-repentis]|nr:Myb-DNA-bind-2 multi-domain protein [Pyrenophora tritici-repentis]